MLQISNRGAIGAADQGQPKTSLAISDDLLHCMMPLLSVAPPLLGVPPNREHCWTMDLRKCRRHVLSSVSNTFQYLESGSVWFWSPRKVLLFRCGIDCIEICFTLQLLHSSPCDLAIVQNAASASNPRLLMQVAPWIQSKLGSTRSCMLKEKNDTSCYIKLSKPAVQACRTDFVFVWQHFFKCVLETSGKGWYQALNWTVPTQKATWWAPWSTGFYHI